MRIGIDATSFDNLRGLGRFTRQLVTQLVGDHSDAHDFVLIANSNCRNLAQQLDCEVVTLRPPREALDHRRPLGHLLAASWKGLRTGADVFLFPAPMTYFPVVHCPNALVLHDTMALDRPGHFFANERSARFYRAKFRIAARLASCILTPSNYSRNRISQTLARSPETIRVVGEAAADFFRPIGPHAANDDIVQAHGLTPSVPLLLCVGSLSPHKNLDGALRALAALRKRGIQNWQLGIVGSLDDPSTLSAVDSLHALHRRLDLTTHVRFLGYVSDPDLASLYGAATALLFPSLEEGFGLPAVEAMACGLPVVASDRGALPEVLGPAALYFQPENTDGMSEAIERALSDEALRNRLRAEGLKRAGESSWQRTAERVLEAMVEIAR